MFVVCTERRVPWKDRVGSAEGRIRWKGAGGESCLLQLRPGLPLCATSQQERGYDDALGMTTLLLRKNCGVVSGVGLLLGVVRGKWDRRLPLSSNCLSKLLPTSALR